MSSSIESKRVQYRKYLERAGVIDALSKALIKLYEEQNKPDDAIRFVRKFMCESCPDDAQFDLMKSDLEEAKKTIIKMELDMERLRSQIKRTPEEIAELLNAGFKALTEDLENTGSLLRKYLTKEILAALMPLYTAMPVEATLYDCVNSGFAHHKSAVGIYAADAHSYDLFITLFDLIIRDYHQQWDYTNLVIQKDVDWGNLDEIENLDTEKKYIISTRIRIARNIVGYPYFAKLREKHYTQIEEAVQKAVKNLTGDHLGTYVSMKDLDFDTQTAMYNRHVLFKRGDEYLTTAGCYRFWPTGRGLYYNPAETFLIWVNEEDHLRIISIRQGGDLGDVYNRLVKGIQELEKWILFGRHWKYGYLTACPTNLGTTLRASVHIRLPLLSKNEEKLKEMATNWSLQIRGTKGEHTAIEDGVMDISNKRRLGPSEFELVKGLQDGILALIRAEEELEAAQDADEDYKKTPEEIAELLNDGFKALTEDEEHSSSLLRKYLTQEILTELMPLYTAVPIEANLWDCINSGLAHHDSSVGVYAADANAYDVYNLLFDPIIREYHGQWENESESLQKDTDWGNLDEIENLDTERKYILSTRIRTARNIEGYPFFPKLQEKHYQEIETKIKTAVFNLADEHMGSYVPLAEMDSDTQTEMVNRHILFKRGDEYLTTAGCYRFWPTGRGLYYNPAETFLIWVNEEDHLRIISMAKCGDLGDVYHRLVTGIQELEKYITFIRHPKYGNLTACPTNLGTTLRASVHIRLPLLARDEDKLKEMATNLNLQIRGTRGEHTSIEDGVMDISNKRRLGFSEFELVKGMQDGILELIRAEEELEAGADAA